MPLASGFACSFWCRGSTTCFPYGIPLSKNSSKKRLSKNSKWWKVIHFCVTLNQLQYIPRNMHTALALLCFVVVMYWLIYPYPSGLLHWHCGNLTIAPMPAKQPWWIWVNASCEFIMNDYITTTKQSTTKPCANFLGYTVYDYFITTAFFVICFFH